MKKLVAFLFALFFSNSLSQNVSPQFSELKGMEDLQGNTHLFYRIYSHLSNDPIYQWNNDIYHWDLNSSSDTLLFYDYACSSPTENYFRRVMDYEFWQNNTSWFIQCGTGGEFHPTPFILRFDDLHGFFIASHGTVRNVDISKQNDSLLFAGAWASDYGTNYKSSLKSIDGGFTWQSISDTLVFLSLNPFNDNMIFAHYEYETSELNDELYRSLDGGISYSKVDSLKRNFQTNIDEFFYDIDETHVYRVFESKYGERILKVSSSNGSPFSWIEKFSSSNKIYLSIDQNISGTIYVADKKNIYLSTNYGDNFNLYKTLERNIVGIYKKPDSNRLYAATKYRIYEIIPDTIQIIKSLPIPDEVLNLYPLSIGNRWVYDEVTVVYDPYPNVYKSILVKEVLGDTLAPNGKHYYEVNDETLWESFVLERIDSSEGGVYRFYEDPLLPENEYLAYDLLAEVGDTLSSYRMGFNTVMFTTMYAETMFNKWGLTKPKKVFQEYTLHPPIFSLTQEIGLDSIYFYFDFGDTWITLKGCVLNGIVYGDTTVVSIVDNDPYLPFEFELSQNYPNPFNSITNIKFVVSGPPARPYPANILPPKSEIRNVILAVYDILGNKIATLVNKELVPGEYEVEFNADGLPSGIYFYKLHSGNYSDTKKMVLMK